jgi:hypothetical protein
MVRHGMMVNDGMSTVSRKAVREWAARRVPGSVAMNPDAVIVEPYRVRAASKVLRLNGKFVSRPKPPAFVPPENRMGRDDTAKYRQPRRLARRLDDGDWPLW